ncbi:lactonase family protein [Demequina muriae]|uniref:Beta-propeller fold lactonase family protein n=1 Tax=Demequina muriae TaxID=3051664 RepID=A0ABT8GFE1_9MICO|nr:beta-propeller fold lactonase family protein [Demequina sp. EGI L300058]MDN4480145.1 beta-propeller fold lactonase family protein [Demequina sp. EGI L300058]
MTDAIPQVSEHGAVWWGTYPEAGLGTPSGLGEGLWRQTAADAHLALELPTPSFVVAHPDRALLYAISETDDTEVHAIDVSDPEQPRVVSTVLTGGASGCHLLLSGDARTLYVSHYMSGDLAVVQLDEQGMPLADVPAQVFGHEGSGPREDRQEASHAHSAGFGPGGHHVLVADLGTDELRRYAIQQDGLLEDHGIAATLPPGAGPRHFAVRGEWIYVLSELDHRLRALRWDAASGTAAVVFDIASTTAPQRTGDEINDSHVLLATDDVLLLGVRGCDVISVVDLSPEGEPRYRGCFDAGHWPRHFAVVGDRLHVGAERGHEVRTFALADVLALPPEPEVGHIATLPFSTAPLPSPACVVAHPA